MSRAVVIAHGIHTSQERAESWMRPLAARILRECPGVTACHPYEYGYLTGTAIRLPFIGAAVRRHEVRRFQQWVAALARRYGPDVELSAIGHSFGTYLIGHAMTDEGEARSFFGRLALMGCILSSRDDWSDKIGHHTAVRNLFSHDDEIVRFSTFGQAGWCGFVCAPPDVENEEMKGFEHDDYTKNGPAWDALTDFLGASPAAA